MQKENIYIKNMVCPRCIEAVQQVFKQLKIPVENISLGEATLLESLNEKTMIMLKQTLIDKGFDLLEDKKAKIVEKVKTLVINLIQNGDQYKHMKISHYLSENISYDYSHISNIFTAHQGVTIEKYVILQKIERAKELLTYNELTLSEIAYQLNYSSPAALSTQFKDITGITPTEFKKLTDYGRKSIDGLIP
jgi:AraC family transcriptional regulator